MGKPTFGRQFIVVRSRFSGGGLLETDGLYKVFNPEYIGVKSKPSELKYLSSWRKGHQPRLPE
jgi:hypothetical protein